MTPGLVSKRRDLRGTALALRVTEVAAEPPRAHCADGKAGIRRMRPSSG